MAELVTDFQFHCVILWCWARLVCGRNSARLRCGLPVNHVLVCPHSHHAKACLKDFKRKKQARVSEAVVEPWDSWRETCLDSWHDPFWSILGYWNVLRLDTLPIWVQPWVWKTWGRWSAAWLNLFFRKLHWEKIRKAKNGKERDGGYAEWDFYGSRWVPSRERSCRAANCSADQKTSKHQGLAKMPNRWHSFDVFINFFQARLRSPCLSRLWKSKGLKIPKSWKQNLPRRHVELLQTHPFPMACTFQRTLEVPLTCVWL